MSNAIHIRNLKPENIKKDVEILKVKGTYEGGGGPGQPVNKDITVNPSTNSQEFSAPSGYTGLGTVTVNPYVLDSKTVDSSTASQVITPDHNGLSSVTVNPYTLDSKTVNSSTASQTVNSSADGLSSVTVNPYTLDTKTVNSSTASQTVNSSADGMSSVTVEPYVLDAKTVSPAVTSQTVNSSADGLSSVTVNAVTASIDANITAGNIKQGETILGVTGTYDGTGGEDWILAAKNTTDAVVNTDTEGLCDVDYGMYGLFEGSNIKTATFTNTAVSGQSTFENAFINCNNATSISFPNLTTVSGSNAFKRAFQGLNCDINFPELKTISGSGALLECNYGRGAGRIYFPKLESITGSSGLAQLYDYGSHTGTQVAYEFPELKTINADSAFANHFISGRGNTSSVGFPKLESIRGTNAFVGFLASNSYCTTLSMPRLLYKQDSTTFKWFWNGMYQPTVTTTPEFFKYSSSSDYDCKIYAKNITLVIPNDYTYLGGWNPSSTHLNFNNSWVDGLSDANILHILQQLGNVSDYDQVNYTVNFATKTIQDNVNFDYTLAKNKLTDAGWTVTGLTINAPDFITITTGSTLNLYNDNTIGFDALYAWTATVDDPSIHLSSASGSAGSGQTITVTMDSGWSSTAHVTLSASNGTYTQTKTVNVIYSDASYTQLEYAEVPTNLAGFALGTSIGVNDDVVFKYRALVANGATMLGYVVNQGTDYSLYTWRVFYYGSSLYWDCGGEAGQGRLYTSGTGFNFSNTTTRNILFKRSGNSFSVKNLDTGNTYSGSRSSTFLGTPSAIGVNGVGPGNPGGENHYFYELTVYPDGYNDGAGTPSAHYIPVKDSNDVTCIYDTVSQNFYYPSSGSLIPGPVIN